MKIQQYFPLKQEQPIWMQHLYLYLIDMAIMMLGAWVFLSIGHFILRMLMANRG
jgi:hypothetical protein